MGYKNNQKSERQTIGPVIKQWHVRGVDFFEVRLQLTGEVLYAQLCVWLQNRRGGDREWSAQPVSTPFYSSLNWIPVIKSLDRAHVSAAEVNPSRESKDFFVLFKRWQTQTAKLLTNSVSRPLCRGRRKDKEVIINASTFVCATELYYYANWRFYAEITDHPGLLGTSGK